MRRSLAFLAAVSTLLANAESLLADSNTLLVPDEFGSIQEAIEAADDGATILVEPEVYIENIDFLGKSLILESTDGADTTIIDGGALTRGDSKGSTVTFNGGSDQRSILTGFTITGGIGTEITTTSGGTVRAGGGIFCKDSWVMLLDNVITGNDGSGIYAIDSTMSLKGIEFEDNHSLNGGGLQAIGQSEVTLRECILKSNSADLLGGGIFVFLDAGSELVAKHCRFEGNSAGIAGGGLEGSSGTFSVHDCEFIDNYSSLVGGGIFSEVGGFIERTSFTGNNADYGGGVAIASQEWLTLKQCVFLQNEASKEGGAVRGESGSGAIELVQCTLVDNRATEGSVVQLRGQPFASAQTVYLNSSILWQNDDNVLAANDGSIVATFTNMPGGSTDANNIDEDPLFVDAAANDFQLQIGSPCIDRGDPELPADADGTLPDQGAHTFLQHWFTRGDADGSGATSALKDAWFLLRWLFDIGEEPGCWDAADSDDDGIVSVTLDALYLLEWQFNGGPTPPVPGPSGCSADPSFDLLDCARAPACD